ncbi:hypothetical protein FisN_9Lh120 [Fistulifera solaris]|uniref:Uncharacterized protein n=1 Tax=Fistulifera solaris TaxID=1519565 RepID=A0A1Z5KKK4_FISSO|nr:hypothetical protein FisN_9Lh120 [Fistulifera solaris]|eukprot:GAX26843.1 hypothetical protein FisN_9Lh120 [Fistulifera solaris]
MSDKTTLGELVYVKFGKIDHPAFRVTSEPPKTIEGVIHHCVQWQMHNYQEYIEADRIQTDLGRRRPRLESSSLPKKSSPQPAMRKVKQEEDDEEEPHTVKDSKEKTQKKKKKRKTTTTTTVKKEESEDEKETKEIKGAESIEDEAAPDLPTSMQPSASNIEVSSSSPNNLWSRVHVKTAQENKVLDEQRPVALDDVLQPAGSDELYIVTGFTSFYNRFRRFADLVEVKHHCYGNKDRQYVREDTITLNPQPGQRLPADMESTISQTFVKKRRALAERWIQRAKHSKHVVRRLAKEGDVVKIGNEMYIVEGFSIFYNRFAQFPTLLQVHSTRTGKCHYIPQKLTRLQLQRGQQLVEN